MGIACIWCTGSVGYTSINSFDDCRKKRMEIMINDILDLEPETVINIYDSLENEDV